MNCQSVAITPITKTMISEVENMAERQGITEIKCFNKDTELTLPNVDWEFGTECEEDDDDCEC